jgi:hypothetical protein
MLKYFIIGILWDAIVTLDVIFTAQINPLGSAITTLILTLLSFFMYSKLIDNGEMRKKEVFSLAFGSAVGTYFMVLFLKA